ncbi:MAG: hypothetical protein GF404_11565 [candidate division Zixibacteria bacterium]|nr:hypothetical protein [candidate division Zixibacteria bacterium]
MAENQTDRKHDERPLYEWVFQPATANWIVTALVTVFLFLLLVLVYYLTQSRFFTIIGTVVLVGSMRSFYFPTTYRLYEDHIEVVYTISKSVKKWGMFRSYYPEKNGVFLSTFARPSRMENFRGLFLKYGAADRDRILEIVRQKIKTEEEEDERSGEDVSASAPEEPENR